MKYCVIDWHVVFIWITYDFQTYEVENVDLKLFMRLQKHS